MNKNKLVKRFNNSEERGSISFDAKQEEKFYTKNYLFNPNSVACGKETVIHDFRYIDWSDITGFVRSRAYKLPYLCHKRPWIDSSYPSGDVKLKLRKRMQNDTYRDDAIFARKWICS